MRYSFQLFKRYELTQKSVVVNEFVEVIVNGWNRVQQSIKMGPILFLQLK